MKDEDTKCEYTICEKCGKTYWVVSGSIKGKKCFCGGEVSDYTPTDIDFSNITFESTTVSC